MGRNRLANERGASAVEFAIIASLLFLILFGTITFGIVFNRIQGLQSSGREGARLGSLTQTTVNEIQNRVLESVSILASANFMSGGSVRSCTGWAQTFDTGCMLIQTKQDLNADDDYSDGGEVTTWSNEGDAPCNTVPQDSNKSIVVDVRYRTEISIPFWASPRMTISGVGEFACERSS